MFFFILGEAYFLRIILHCNYRGNHYHRQKEDADAQYCTDETIVGTKPFSL
jgi:hypothetical protein